MHSAVRQFKVLEYNGTRDRFRTNLSKRRFASIGDHGERCDSLLLNISFRRFARLSRIEQLEQPLNDRIKVW